eukprot:1540227-Alexandrium_andersonii.AAC.1
MELSLAILESKGQRDDFVCGRQSGQDFTRGTRGQKLCCRRNIANYQREEGHVLRLLMRACKDTWGPLQA